MWRVWGRKEGCTGCWWRNLSKRGRWGDPDVDGRIILRWIFRELEWGVGTGWSWLRIGIGGGFHKNALNFLTSCKPVSFSRRTLLYGVNEMHVNSGFDS
jgi:hypothetical protein